MDEFRFEWTFESCEMSSLGDVEHPGIFLSSGSIQNLIRKESHHDER